MATLERELPETSPRTTPRDPVRLFLDGVPDYAIFMLDPHGHVLSWNQGAANLFGYDPPEIIGQTFARFFAADEIGTGRPDAELREAEERGHAEHEEWQVRKDGTRFWASGIMTALRDERGGLQGFARVLRDITDRKQLEEELRRQAEELAEANRQKDEFLAMLSHELRNPLAPVLNSVHILRQAGNNPEIVRQSGTMIERQIRHMAHMIDDLLEVTRVTRGRLRLRREPVELNGLARWAADSVRPLMEDRGHTLRLQLHPRPLWTDGDPTRLDQILVNLLQNAARYTDPGGTVTLTTERQGNEAVLRVRDTGIGIAADMLPRVFDLFAQADRSLDRKRGGLGIGLTLVRRLVTLHGGSIEAASEGPGRGAEFIVRLPALAEPTGPATVAAVGVPRKSLKALVVDDHVDCASSLGTLLRLHGHSVELAHSGQAALDAAANDTFDVILLDIGLPGLDGFEVARRLRQRGAPRPLLVAVSGYGNDVDLERSRQAGFDHHLVKPVDPDALEQVLTRAFS